MVSAESQAAMDAAKQAVIDFMNKNGRHNTTVHERVAPAIYHETITRIEHEDLVTVVDREVTQDHYHTSVQPITDSETLEEQHHHNELAVEERTFQHDDQDDVRARLTAERDQFRDEVQRVDGDKTQTVVPTLSGEHIHHHVHEIIQPVVSKYVIEPHVVHTTSFIRELHHNPAKHHTLSALPAVTMAEYQRQGGILIGREERWDSFEGEPRSVGGNMGGSDSGFSNVIIPPTPERRSTLPTPQPERRTTFAANAQAPASPAPAPAPTVDNTDRLPAQATPSAQAVTEARKLGEGPAAPVPAPQQQQQQQQAPAAPSSSGRKNPGQQQPGQQAGRFNLLPMHLAGSAGEGQPGHLPVRTARGGQGEGRQGSVSRARGGQSQQQPPPPQEPSPQDQPNRRGS